jgi:hypothetical protein
MEPTFEEAILRFLQENRQSAYTPEEIAVELNPKTMPFVNKAVQQDVALDTTLENLRARKAIIGKWQDGPLGTEAYYAAL